MPHTHDVTNQVPPHTGLDISTHPALWEALHREGAGWAEDEVRELALLANSETVQGWGRLADTHPPVLRTHDRYGNRIDEVDYLPQYHELMRTAVEHGLHGAP
ncbi:MAG: DNA alkylation response protein, partial [Actinocrinis sp.]